VFITTMSRARAAARSTLSTPAPARQMHRSARARAIAAASTFVAERMIQPWKVGSWELLDDRLLPLDDLDAAGLLEDLADDGREDIRDQHTEGLGHDRFLGEGVKGCGYRNLPTQRQALCPPKPKLFEIATSIRSSRGSFGT
jgi:hypothetical protein